jgi:hypothetical protein
LKKTGKLKKIVSILFFALLLTNSSFSQKLTAVVSSNKVAVGDPFQIQFSLSGNGTNLKLPPLPDFEIVEGPYQSSSTSIINGAVSQSSSLTYVMVAKKEGKITIGAASVSAGGKIIQSNTIDMEVTKGKAPATNQNSSSGQNVTPPSTNDIGDNMFLKASVSKSKAYLGELINVKVKLYTRTDFTIRDFKKVPSYAGFFLQEIKERGTPQSTQTKETINGVNYAVFDIYETYLIPQQTGQLTIEPYELNCIVRQKSTKRPRSIIEQIMGGGYEDIPYTLKSKTVTIDVSPLPEANKPANFSGAVGEYSYKAQLNKDKVKADEGVNLTITVSGKGNLKLIDPVKVLFPEDFETYDPKTTENINVTTNGISGTKTFDYLIIPRHEGDYKIDQLNFSYFDPTKKEYITLPSPEFNLHVDKGNSTAATVVGINSHQEDVKVLGNDIRYIKTNNIHLKEKNDFFFGSTLFVTGLISPFLAFLAFVFIRRKNIEQNKDVVAVKSRKATKMARKRLSIAEQHLKSANKELFYEEIFKSLYGYISNKLNIPVADLNKEHISQTFQLRNVTELTIQQLIKTLDNCEYARYAPSAVSGDLKTIYDSTVELITKIENEIK